MFQPLTGPVLVHDQSGPSAPAGDLISNDYQITIPNVNNASYHGTLDYIATATRKPESHPARNCHWLR